ncbi:MAG: FumA C-terminus/TtdB family hydratase beta subunit [Candidatus Margulisbacteria bacterium]|jgi:fumarate hydratase subunit beta|nr:FumA C-terminus/TtdB family hydratase beta subunit [Candidatus Margulisiibacteriota bacterium]
MTYRIILPLLKEDMVKFRAGEELLLNGIIYTARDAAHKKLHELLLAGKPLPFKLPGQIIYYTGPSPAPPGRPIGSAGPTTSDRMDPFTPELLALGLSAVIGKGPRSAEVRQALRQNQALYLGALGGAGALLAQAVTAAEVIAFPELGTEAIRRLTVRDFPVTVLYDLHGGDLYASR